MTIAMRTILVPFLVALTTTATLVPSNAGVEESRQETRASGCILWLNNTPSLRNSRNSDANDIDANEIAPIELVTIHPTFADPSPGCFTFFCGAVLIWPDVLLSSAHCVDSFNRRTIQPTEGAPYKNVTGALGDLTIVNNLNNSSETIEVKSVLQYPSFNDAFGIEHDIMLIFLASPSNATTSKWNTDPAVPTIGQKTTMFGLTMFGLAQSPGSSGRPKETSALISSTEECAKEYRYPIFPETLFCANDDLVDTGRCGVGFSVVALFGANDDENNNSNGVVVGLPSFYSCAKPHGYLRVSYYADWITGLICKLSLVAPNATTDPTGVAAMCDDNAPAAAPTGKTPFTSSAGVCGLSNCEKRQGFGGSGGFWVHRFSRNLNRCRSRCVSKNTLELWLTLGWTCGDFCNSRNTY